MKTNDNTSDHALYYYVSVCFRLFALLLSMLVFVGTEAVSIVRLDNNVLFDALTFCLLSSKRHTAGTSVSGIRQGLPVLTQRESGLKEAFCIFKIKIVTNGNQFVDVAFLHLTVPRVIVRSKNNNYKDIDTLVKTLTHW